MDRLSWRLRNVLHFFNSQLDEMPHGQQQQLQQRGHTTRLSVHTRTEHSTQSIKRYLRNIDFPIRRTTIDRSHIVRCTTTSPICILSFYGPCWALLKSRPGRSTSFWRTYSDTYPRVATLDLSASSGSRSTSRATAAGTCSSGRASISGTVHSRVCPRLARPTSVTGIRTQR